MYEYGIVYARAQTIGENSNAEKKKEKKEKQWKWQYLLYCCCHLFVTTKTLERGRHRKH